MEANVTRIGALALVCLFSINCQQKSPRVNSTRINGQTCESQAMQNSFLVSWKGQVPKRFKHLKLSPGSDITRFRGISKEELEEKILKGFHPEDLTAEHEFRVSIEHSQVVHPAAGSTPDAWGIKMIRASDAWSRLGKQGDGIVVAVIDSGFDTSHPLLNPQLWVNPGESGTDANGRNKATNGIDDDGDGRVDDVYGWNFFAGNNDLTDGTIPHGTHVSGIVLGKPGRYNFVGVAPAAKLMALKFMGSDGTGDIGDAITGMEYAVQHGAKVINASWGGGYCSTLLKDKIAWAAGQGVAFFAAAGNNTEDINNNPKWPAAFIVPGKLTVGAIGPNSVLSSYSNFGPLVDVAAPGDDILSTVPVDPSSPLVDPLALMSGTSMATPFTSGLAAVLLSAKPSMSPVQLTEAILGGLVHGNNIGIRTQGRIDALNSANYVLSH